MFAFEWIPSKLQQQIGVNYFCILYITDDLFVFNYLWIH